MISLQAFAEIVQSEQTAWLPPGEAFSFLWTQEQSGIYNGTPYYKPAGILITVSGQKFLIQNNRGVLTCTQGAKNLVVPGTLIENPEIQARVDEYFSKLAEHIAQSKKPTSVGRPEVSDSDLTRFFSVLSQALPKSLKLSSGQLQSLQTEVKNAIAEPAEFFNAHAQQFADRGIKKAQTDLYQWVLIDGLLKLGVVTELDWKDEARDHSKKGEQVLEWEADSDSHLLMPVSTELAKDLIAAAKAIHLTLSFAGK